MSLIMGTHLKRILSGGWVTYELQICSSSFDLWVLIPLTHYGHKVHVEVSNPKLSLSEVLKFSGPSKKKIIKSLCGLLPIQ